MNCQGSIRRTLVYEVSYYSSSQGNKSYLCGRYCSSAARAPTPRSRMQSASDSTLPKNKGKKDDGVHPRCWQGSSPPDGRPLRDRECTVSHSILLALIISLRPSSAVPSRRAPHEHPAR